MSLELSTNLSGRSGRGNGADRGSDGKVLELHIGKMGREDRISGHSGSGVQYSAFNAAKSSIFAGLPSQGASCARPEEPVYQSQIVANLDYCESDNIPMPERST
jgi:hypothetical protein